MPARTPHWSETALAEARATLAEAFPACPPSLAERFVELLTRPRAELLARATRILEKPYGRNHLLDADGDHGISFAAILPGRTTSLHWHGRRRELFAVRSGRLAVTLGDQRVTLEVGTVACSTPRVPHALANGGDHDAEVLELFSPYLLDDKVRVHDPYGRLVGAVTVDQ